ncbi:hypothetical protein pb186bvf_011400 [Paramecium bursaria]
MRIFQLQILSREQNHKNFIFFILILIMPILADLKHLVELKMKQQQKDRQPTPKEKVMLLTRVLYEKKTLREACEELQISYIWGRAIWCEHLNQYNKYQKKKSNTHKPRRQAGFKILPIDSHITKLVIRVQIKGNVIRTNSLNQEKKQKKNVISIQIKLNLSLNVWYLFKYILEESQYSDHPGGWIDWFCAHEDHQFLCDVDEEFIRDPFNSFDLKPRFPLFNEALNMILQPEMPEDQDLEDERFNKIYQEASDLYGLLHARFIFTTKGSAIMRERYLQGKFGYCPRIYCEKQHVLPIGLCEDLKTTRVKVFCPRCEEVYLPKKKCADLDGAYFGRSFPQYLLMTFPDVQPKYLLLPDTKIKTDFEPTLFGFKIVGKVGSKVKLTDIKQNNENINPNKIINSYADTSQKIDDTQKVDGIVKKVEEQKQQPVEQQQQSKKKKNKRN